MKNCPVCTYSNPIRTSVCQRCGAVLSDTIMIHKLPKYKTDLGKQTAPFYGTDEVHNTRTTGPLKGGYLRFKIFGEPKPLMIEPKEEIILGRRDAAYPIQPDLDFSPFSGYRRGVSRRHAKINCVEAGYLLLTDLGSSNGTYLNDTKLVQNHTYRLHDGDKITLGKMVMYLHYK